jgi:hypothetical protein
VVLEIDQDQRNDVIDNVDRNLEEKITELKNEAKLAMEKEKVSLKEKLGSITKDIKNKEQQELKD